MQKKPPKKTHPWENHFITFSDCTLINLSDVMISPGPRRWLGTHAFGRLHVWFFAKCGRVFFFFFFVTLPILYPDLKAETWITLETAVTCGADTWWCPLVMTVFTVVRPLPKPLEIPFSSPDWYLSTLRLTDALSVDRGCCCKMQQRTSQENPVKKQLKLGLPAIKIPSNDGSCVQISNH